MTIPSASLNKTTYSTVIKPFISLENSRNFIFLEFSREIKGTLLQLNQQLVIVRVHSFFIRNPKSFLKAILTLEFLKSFFIFKKLLDSGTFIKVSYFRFKKLWLSGGRKLHKKCQKQAFKKPFGSFDLRIQICLRN